MILADTSVWVDHFRRGDAAFQNALNAGTILMHPFVIGELALGHLKARKRILESMHELPMAFVATESEVLHLIEREQLYGRGVGYVDVHLLAAARLTGSASLWTRDRILLDAAHSLGLAHAER